MTILYEVDDVTIKRDHYDSDSRVSHNVDVAVNCNVNSFDGMRDPTTTVVVSMVTFAYWKKRLGDVVEYTR